MDYHSSRYDDCSLLAYRNGKLAALLPANIRNGRLISHEGLTYGGWCLPGKGLDCSELTLLWSTWLSWCESSGIGEVIYKPLPSVYQSMPSEEDRYLLFRSGAKLIRSDISSAINLLHNPGFNTLQKRHIAHAPADLRVSSFSATDFKVIQAFHSMLADCLRERHDTAPVHSIEELRILAERFPENIVFWIGTQNDSYQCGICIYLTRNCAHAQYIATTPQGREQNLLAPLVREIINFYTEKGVEYLDFGISTEDDGWKLNDGLNRQKTSYGASGVAYDRWLISVSDALKLLPTC